jgi:hypothetical protein
MNRELIVRRSAGSSRQLRVADDYGLGGRSGSRA